MTHKNINVVSCHVTNDCCVMCYHFEYKWEIFLQLLMYLETVVKMAFHNSIDLHYLFLLRSIQIHCHRHPTNVYCYNLFHMFSVFFSVCVCVCTLGSIVKQLTIAIFFKKTDIAQASHTNKNK